MTAASRHHSSPSPRGFPSQRLERIALLLVVCVPVPAVALSGLNVPLPSIVERAAAALVPWANVVTLDTSAQAATHGSIVHAAGLDDQHGARSVDVEAAARRLAPPRTRALGPRPTVTKVDEPSKRAANVDVAGPDTRPRVPVTPTAPGGDDGGHEDPAPGPAEPTAAPEPAPPADQPSGNVPATPPAPTPVPTPDRDQKDRDEKPDTNVTPTTPSVPADEADDVPPDADTKPPDEKPVDPDLPPPAEQPGRLPDSSAPRDDGAGSDGSGK